MSQSGGSFTRKRVNTEALRLAARLRHFAKDADQHLSIKMRDNLIEMAKDLEEMALS